MPRKRNSKEMKETDGLNPTTPDSGYGSTKHEGAPPKKRIRTPKQPSKEKEPEYHVLEAAGGAVGPLSVAASVEGRNSMMDDKSGEHRFMIRVASQRSFEFKNAMTDDNGCVHLILEPAKPFPLMRLPGELLTKILELVLLPEGDPAAKILIKSTITGPRSKNFAEGLKDRLGLLRASKKIYEEALPLLYGQRIKFDDTTTLSKFMLRIHTAAKNLIDYIEIITFKKDTGSMALSALTQCPQLRRVHMATNVGLTSSPSKAAKQFYAENSFFFESVATPADPYRGISLLTFGKSVKCFSIKDGDGEKRAWTDEEKDEFVSILKSQIKSK